MGYLCQVQGEMSHVPLNGEPGWTRQYIRWLSIVPLYFARNVLVWNWRNPDNGCDRLRAYLHSVKIHGAFRASIAAVDRCWKAIPIPSKTMK